MFTESYDQPYHYSIPNITSQDDEVLHEKFCELIKQEASLDTANAVLQPLIAQLQAKNLALAAPKLPA